MKDIDIRHTFRHNFYTLYIRFCLSCYKLIFVMLDICNNHSTHHTRIRVSSKIIFCLGQLWEQRLNPIFQQSMSDCRCLYPASATIICGFNLFNLSYKVLKVRLSCSFPGMYCVTKNPAMLITGSFYRIRKNMFMLTFSNHPLSGSLVLHFCVFTPSGISSGSKVGQFQHLQHLLMLAADYHLFSLLAFSMHARRSFRFLFYFSSSSYQSLFTCNSFCIFCCLHRLLYVFASTKI